MRTTAEELDAWDQRMLAWAKTISANDPRHEGFKNFYESRILSGEMISADERHVFAVVAEKYPEAGQFVMAEACAGLGTLTAALVLAGHLVRAIECDIGRAGLARCLRRHLGYSYPVRCTTWQDYALERMNLLVPLDVLIFTNCVSSRCDEDGDAKIIDYLVAHGTDVIIRPDLYGGRAGMTFGSKTESVGNGYLWLNGAGRVDDAEKLQR